ncbi:MAG: glycosyltransferase [Candidatus Omnitrophica bacterium]|nr:glycosyltransferase [Candidatus Omnitrophota bacterium]
MRIVFLVGSFPAVSETFILNQITGLMDLGHEVLIFAGAGSYERVVHPVVVSRGLLKHVRYYHAKPRNWIVRVLCFLWHLPGAFRSAPDIVLRSLDVSRYGREALSLNLFFMTKAFLEVRDFDAVVAHFGANGLVASRMKDLGVIRGKVVVFFHAIDLTAYPRRYGQDVYRHLFEQADLLLPVSDHAKDRLAALGCPENKMRIHRMGVALTPFRPKAPGAVFRIISVARFVDKKGLAYAIDAVAELHRAGIPVEYTLVGDGPRYAELKERVRHSGMEGQVHFLGWQNAAEVLGRLYAADVLVAPSIQAENGDEEGIPVVLMEAMAAGVGVVTTPTGAIAELVEDRQTGFLVPPQDAAALAGCLRAVWEHPETIAPLLVRARQAIETGHDIARLNYGLQDLLQEVCCEKK